MSKATKQQKPPAKMPGAEFTVSDYLLDVKLLKYEELCLDTNLEFGQIRTVSEEHRQRLATAFRTNPPAELLDITTWASQGKYLPLPP